MLYSKLSSHIHNQIDIDFGPVMQHQVSLTDFNAFDNLIMFSYSMCLQSDSCSEKIIANYFKIQQCRFYLTFKWISNDIVISNHKRGVQLLPITRLIILMMAIKLDVETLRVTQTNLYIMYNKYLWWLAGMIYTWMSHAREWNLLFNWTQSVIK